MSREQLTAEAVPKPPFGHFRVPYLALLMRSNPLPPDCVVASLLAMTF